MKSLYILPILLASCCGPKGMVSVTVPEASTEGQATATEVVPDSVASPCDSLRDALEVLKSGITDRDTLHAAPAKAKAKRAVQAIKEQVCKWEPIDINTDRITGRIWPAPDGTPLFKVTCKEVRSEPVPCHCESKVPLWAKIVMGALFGALIVQTLRK